MPGKQDNQQQIALQILIPYTTMLDRQSPEYTIHELREALFTAFTDYEMTDFTFGLRLLLEEKYVRRLNDERLELTPTGREWLTSNLPDE